MYTNIIQIFWNWKKKLMIWQKFQKIPGIILCVFSRYILWKISSEQSTQKARCRRISWWDPSPALLLHLNPINVGFDEEAGPTNTIGSWGGPQCLWLRVLLPPPSRTTTPCSTSLSPSMLIGLFTFSLSRIFFFYLRLITQIVYKFLLKW